MDRLIHDAQGLNTGTWPVISPVQLVTAVEHPSTGHWSGFALGDVLLSVGVAEQARYVEFTGLDQVERHGRRFGFGGSIDLAKALSSEVILATSLNGAPLPPAHGFPLRAVVPGWVGARSIKWLGRVTLSAAPSHNYFQREAYRVQRKADPDQPRDVSAGTALDAVPVNAVILEPRLGQTVRAGRVPVRGWAIGTGGRELSRIELSPNAGQDWMPVQIAAAGAPWTWTLWEAFPQLEPGRHTLVVKATDAAGATQPPTLRDTWNVKGYANNAWHRVSVLIE